MSRINRQFLLAARPVGMIKRSDFEYREAPAPEAPGSGAAVVRNLYVSIDPAMRGWMVNRADYVAPLAIGDVMRAGCVARVEASRRDDLREGDLVVGSFGWQDYAIAGEGGASFTPYRSSLPPTAALSVLSTTGYTAYFGMLDIGRPESGQTVVVSGAAGAVGSLAGQIAKLKGCRAVGIAGGPEKCRWITGELGFDAAIDYKNDDVGARLDALVPRGIDVYFDNVGGAILDAALARLANRARVVLCGGISRSNAVGPTPGPANYFNLVFRRARMEGFIVVDYAPRFAEAARELEAWVQAGRLKYREHVVEGFEKLPDALIGIFRGENIGKQMVHIA
jgi:hypothetical protein